MLRSATIALLAAFAASSLSFNLGLLFHGWMDKLMLFFSFINLDLGGFLPFGCMVEMNHFMNLYSMTSSALSGSHNRAERARVDWRAKEEAW